MEDNDKLTRAFNEYEKLLLSFAEEHDYAHEWIFYKLKEKFGIEIAQKVMQDKWT